MAEITSANLNAARILIGAKKTRVLGAAEDFWALEFMGDVGALLSGLQGDTMHVIRTNNAFMLNLNLMPASSAIGTVLKQWSTGIPFGIAIDFNDFNFVGIASLINPGAWAANATPAPRALTLGLSYISGNLISGIGEVVSVA
jgi:hypothetical protein